MKVKTQIFLWRVFCGVVVVAATIMCICLAPNFRVDIGSSVTAGDIGIIAVAPIAFMLWFSVAPIMILMAIFYPP